MRNSEEHSSAKTIILVFLFTLTAVTLAGLVFLTVFSHMRTKEQEENNAEAEPVVTQSVTEAVSQQTAQADVSMATDIQDATGEGSDEEGTGNSDVGSGDADAKEDLVEEEPAFVDPYAEVPEEFFVRRVQAADPDVVTMAFAGDILFDAGYAIQARVKDDSIAGSVGASLLEEMNRVDLMVINNEFPYTDRGAPQPDKIYTFHAKPRTVRQLKEMGADLVSLANNHTFDYGEEGFLDTLDTLDRAGVPRIGAGRNIDEASHPMYFLVDGMKIAVVAATQIERYPTPNTRGATDTLAGVFRCMDDTLLCERVREASQESDFVIVFIHWGTENEVQPDWLQVKQGPELAEAGADLIIGCHSHCLQPLGVIDGVPVVYSMGNFLFNSKTLDSCLISCEIERVDDAEPAEQGDNAWSGTGSARARLKSLHFLPCIQSGCAVRFAEGAEKDRILQFMRGISPDVSIDEDGLVLSAR